MPMRIVTEWEHPETHDNMCSVAILLPSGAAENIEELSVSVEGGDELLIRIPWPSSLLNTSRLLHSRVVGDVP